MIPIILVVCLLQALASDAQRNFGHERVVENLLQNYGDSQRLVRPGVNTSAQIGVSLVAVKSFCDKTGKLTAGYWLKESWTDERLLWEDTSIAHVRFPIQYLWRPDFRVFNSLDVKDDVDLNASPIVYQGGSVLWVPPAEYTTRCDAPVGESNEWSCELKIGSWTLDGYEMNLSFYNNKTEIDLEYYKPELNGWNISPEESSIETRYYPCCAETPYSSAKFMFKISKIEGGVADSGTRTAAGMSIVGLLAVQQLLRAVL